MDRSRLLPTQDQGDEQNCEEVFSSRIINGVSSLISNKSRFFVNPLTFAFIDEVQALYTHPLGLACNIEIGPQIEGDGISIPRFDFLQCLLDRVFVDETTRQQTRIYFGPKQLFVSKSR